MAMYAGGGDLLSWKKRLNSESKDHSAGLANVLAL